VIDEQGLMALACKHELVIGLDCRRHPVDDPKPSEPPIEPPDDGGPPVKEPPRRRLARVSRAPGAVPRAQSGARHVRLVRLDFPLPSLVGTRELDCSRRPTAYLARKPADWRLSTPVGSRC